MSDYLKYLKNKKLLQNNLAYECAGWLASNEGGPLFNRIKFLESNQPTYTIIKANSWLDYSRYWYI